MEDVIILFGFMLGLCAALLIASGIAAVVAIWLDRRPQRSMAVKRFRTIRMWNL